MPDEIPLVQVLPSSDDKARIAIDCARTAPSPINRNLFGKFTEHLGRNIYNGMWAQILQNSSFADWSLFKNVWRGDSRHTHEFSASKFRTAYERGLACWWLPYGSEDATYLIDWIEPFNSDTSQRITVSGDEAGIAQDIYLPAHRIRDFTVSFHARGQAESIKVTLLHGETGDLLADATVSGFQSEWQPFTASLNIPEGALAKGAPVEFRIGLPSPGQVWIDQVFLFPDDHVSGFDPDVIRFLKDSRLPLLRYPGGNFVSGYHWRDGVGPLHNRPVLPNPAWRLNEPNHVGTDEFIAFCRAVGCEPLICVNAGNGTPKEAAEWVDYCNGSVDTENGSLRAENGHSEPYNIRYWEIGNELYGRWQIGHCSPPEYAERYEAFHTALMAVDPALLIIANGQSLEWNAPLMERKGKLVRSYSLHTLSGGRSRQEEDPEAVYKALMGYTASYDNLLQALQNQATPHNPESKIAITEHQIMCRGSHLPTNATQTESLYLAGALHSALRQGDLVEMFTHSALVNHGGGLKKEREIVYPSPVHWVSHLYANLPQATLVQSITESPTFDADIAAIISGTDFPYLDAVGVLTDNNLTLLVINRHPTDSIEVSVSVETFSLDPKAEMQTLSGESYMSRNSWESPDGVKLETHSVPIAGSTFSLSISPHSVNALFLEKKCGIIT